VGHTRLVLLLDFLLAIVEQEELESTLVVVVSFVLLVMVSLAGVALDCQRVVLDESAHFRHRAACSCECGASLKVSA
jgi:hypothetical protein